MDWVDKIFKGIPLSRIKDPKLLSANLIAFIVVACGGGGAVRGREEARIGRKGQCRFGGQQGSDTDMGHQARQPRCSQDAPGLRSQIRKSTSRER